MERGERAWAWRELAVEPATSTTQLISRICGRRKRRQGGSRTKSRAKYHEGKSTYTDLGRKETPSVGRLAVAEGSLSRRRALKLFAGTAIAALIPSRVLADDGCVKICHIPFDITSTGAVVCHRGEAETRCVRPDRVQFHLQNHPCDCLRRCAATNKCRTTTTTTTTSKPSTTTTVGGG